MAEKNTMQMLLVILATIGAIALIVLLAMWVMMAGMMGSGMGMMSCCQNMVVVNWILGLLIAVGLVSAIILFMRRSR